MSPEWDEVRFLQEVQDGVVTRDQLMHAGLSYGDIQRLVRRRDLRRLASGVYVDHTGPPSWVQRAWTAVLACHPAALSHESVWHETSPIHVAVGHERRIASPTGVVLHRMRHFEERVDWRRSPPRVRVEQAVLDVAGAARDDFAAIAALADVVQRRRTSYTAIRMALEGRRRMPRGRWLAGALEDLALGANSVLEHEYLIRIERAHGLPHGERQLVASADGRRVERDVCYSRYGLIVELVGRAFHDDVLSWDRDLDRDLAATVDDDAQTVRLGWGQVLRRSCRTAFSLGALLNRGGWPERPRRCVRCE